MRSLKKMGIASAALLALILTGCSGINFDKAAGSFNAAQVDCVDVAGDLEDAIEARDTAKAKYYESRGRLTERTAKATFEAAQDKVDKLRTRSNSNECRGEASPSASPSPSASAEACGDARFVQVFVDRANSSQIEPRYDAKVRPIINNAALSAEQKVEAIQTAEFELAGSNAITLASWAHGAGLYKNANAWPELVEGGKIVDGACLTQKGMALFWKYEGAVLASSLEVSQASPDAINSGSDGTTIVVDANPGIGGDLTSIKIILPDGSIFEKLVRCGNMAFPGRPNLPPGKTDNQKNPAEDPFPNGKANTGGGPNADRGPGAQLQVTQPGSAPYVAPAAPAPTVPTPAPGNPTPVPTLDPAPAPTKEPEAPVLDGPTPPPSTCIIPPGEESC